MIKMMFFAIFLVISGLAFSQESLKITWTEEYEWKLISNQENENTHIIEIIPGKEEASSWTMLGQMMSIKGTVSVPMEQAQNLMYNQTKLSSPDSKLTFLEKDEDNEYPWILFKIESAHFKDGVNPESQLWYIRQGKTSLYVNFIAVKEKTLEKNFSDHWSAVFKTSEIVELGDN